MPEQDPFQDTVAAEIAFLRGEIHILLDQHHDRDPHLFRLGRLLAQAENAYHHTRIPDVV